MGTLILITLLTVSILFGEEYIVRTEDLSLIPGRVLKKISEDTYLVDIEERIRGLAFPEGVVVEKNHKLYALQTPNDPCLSYKWDLDFIRAFDAWDLSTGSGTIYVAVLDTGVNYNHPDLRDNLWRNSDEDCGNDLDDDGNGYADDCYGIDVVNGDSDPMDDNGHGTALAGVVGAVGNNGTLIAGVNWNVKIIPCRFLDSTGAGDIAGEIECLNYILSLKRSKGLNIVAVNASYGAVYPPSQTQRDKIAELATEGILYITAAGNSGLNNDLNDMHPCNYDLPNVVCVGSVGNTGNRSSFSNYGFYTVDLSAPGENILTLDSSDTGTDCNSLVYYSGTSLSTPVVSGAVALLKSYNSSLNYTQIKERLLTTGRNNLNLAGQTLTCNTLDLYNLLQGDNSPKVCPSALTLSWGNISECGLFTRTFTVRNTGGQSVSVLSVAVSGVGFSILRDNCTGRTLSTLQECTVELSFSPSQEGTFDGLLEVRFSNPALNFTVSLYSQSTVVCVSGGGGGCSTGGFNLSLLIPILILLRKFLRT